MKKFLFVLSLISLMLVSCTSPVQDEIVEDVVVEEATETPTVEETTEEVTEEEPEEVVETVEVVEEEPEEDVWVEVSYDVKNECGSQYVYFPEELDVTTDYTFRNNTDPKADYNLFKFEYVKTMVANGGYTNDEDRQYLLSPDYESSDNAYETVKLYKLYINEKYTGDEIIFTYNGVYEESGDLICADKGENHGYRVTKTDNGYELILCCYWEKSSSQKCYDHYNMHTLIYSHEVTEE